MTQIKESITSRVSHFAKEQLGMHHILGNVITVVLGGLLLRPPLVHMPVL